MADCSNLSPNSVLLVRTRSLFEAHKCVFPRWMINLFFWPFRTMRNDYCFFLFARWPSCQLTTESLVVAAVVNARKPDGPLVGSFDGLITISSVFSVTHTYVTLSSFFAKRISNMVCGLEFACVKLILLCFLKRRVQ